ncbi:hypothetical protein VTN00DRAFT_4779 [Thermoascus crustaceus]|uniref:uncharacterized protein n=1 Tax=Thermoascus crustaceus TaxID=5088 RepID=UPI00374331A7
MGVPSDDLDKTVMQGLWDEAKQVFYNELGEKKREKLRERTRLEDTVQDLKFAQEKASKQYGTHSGSVAGKFIELRLGRLMRRLELMLQVGDVAVKYAPETKAALDVLQELHQYSKVLNDLFDTIDLVVAPAIKGIQAEQAKLKKSKTGMSWNGASKTSSSANLEERHPGTCKWIFERGDVGEFRRWHRNEVPSILWLRGEGGFGKSILVSSTIESLENETEQQSSGKPLLVYFFCKTGDEATSRGTKATLHLLSQLFSKASAEEQKDIKNTAEDRANLLNQERCMSIVKETKGKLKESARKDSSLTQITSVLQPMFEDLAKALDSRVYVIVDALDKCFNWDAGPLDAFKGLPKRGSEIRVLISSCPENGIARALEMVPTVAMDKSRTEADIRSYIVGSLKAFRHWKPEQRAKASSIIASQRGNLDAKMTLFAKLMSDLPRGMNDLYRQTMQSLEPGHREMLLAALRWLMRGKGKTEVFPIADELEHVYHEDEEWDVEDIADFLAEAVSEIDIADFGGYDEDFRETIDDLVRIGREFLGIGKKTAELQHNSIRDFIEEDEKLMQRQSLLCYSEPETSPF